jgi:hypothetical protein
MPKSIKKRLPHSSSESEADLPKPTSESGNSEAVPSNTTANETSKESTVKSWIFTAGHFIDPKNENGVS